MTTLTCPVGLSLECFVCAKNKVRAVQAMRSGAKNSTSVKNKRLLEKEFMTPEVVCKGCKVQRYCSLTHLLEDRAEHVDLCRVLRDLLTLQKLEHPLLQHGVISSPDQLQMVISQLKLVLRVKLRRPLTPREHHVISNPGICEVCFKTGAPLKVCKDCAGVAYCCEDHRHQDAKKHSPKECRTLALISSPFRQFDCLLNLKSFHQCVDLSRSHLIDAFFKATTLRIDDNPQNIAACSSFSGIASTCLALTNISWISYEYSAVIVYVVGATEEHLRYFQEMHLRFFFLQYQSIQNLDLYFIGPNLLPRESSSKKVFRFRGLLRTVVKHFFSETFTTFAETMKVDPTVILLLEPDFIHMGTATEQLVSQLVGQKNGGAVDFDWQSCLGTLLRTYGVPICYTSPTRFQAMADFTAFHIIALINNVTIERVYNITENPYREILPLYNFSDLHNERIIYANNYLEVIFSSIKRV
ncbi:uncharacterized protein [Drosophila kikkawai]|uniref:MYND-type domain-containing protein n=1 Tax=Drosophila kikkawai TaxID=30033 RepID=A0A6P4I7Q3_DROKI|nr:uncharacterized protein LOC108072096 [Drosophila kikkawai]